MLTHHEETVAAPVALERRWTRALRLDWLGQMVASVLWGVSVFVYGIHAFGDVLQLCAAIAWTVANVDVLFRASDAS